MFLLYSRLLLLIAVVLYELVGLLASVTAVAVAAAATVAVPEYALAPRHLELCFVLLAAVGARIVQRVGHV